MPSAIAHAAPALALIPAFANRATPARLWIAGALCAAAPDLDVIGFAFGIPYGHWLGHRGVTHGIPFAAALAAAVAWVWFRPLRVRAWLYLFFATASHGALDALTNGGLGVALLSPFDTTRYFAPFRPIEVSPIGIAGFLSARGVAILENELVWVWLPCLALGAALLPLRSHSLDGQGRGV
ncbi:MAG TPA: metal-dependent hydrolase [Myxococcota bacterium]|nr:metal-dependent hydrolase [Myxococcota bacterium]